MLCMGFLPVPALPAHSGAACWPGMYALHEPAGQQLSLVRTALACWAQRGASIASCSQRWVHPSAGSAAGHHGISALADNTPTP